VVSSDSTRRFNQNIGILTSFPSTIKEIVKPSSEFADGFLHERDREEVVRDHHYIARQEISTSEISR